MPGRTDACIRAWGLLRWRTPFTLMVRAAVDGSLVRAAPAFAAFLLPFAAMMCPFRV